MYPGNQFYGHRAVLAHHAGLPSTTPIRGHIQHGWEMGAGVPPSSQLVSWLPRLVWSDRNLAAARSAGLKRITAIGAPFLYLASGHPAKIGPSDADAGAIFYPYHSSEWDELEGSHERLVDQVRERESGPVTACLYWLEFDNPSVRRVYQDAGFRVVCHGHRSDTTFLFRQLAELGQHDRLITNRVSTATWYGGYVGLSLEVYGEVFAWTGQRARADSVQRSEWPELFDGGLDGAAARAVAATELGANHMRSAAELRSLVAPWVAHPPDWDMPPMSVVSATRSRLVTAAARTEHYARALLRRGTAAMHRLRVPESASTS